MGAKYNYFKPTYFLFVQKRGVQVKIELMSPFISGFHCPRLKPGFKLAREKNRL